MSVPSLRHPWRQHHQRALAHGVQRGPLGVAEKVQLYLKEHGPSSRNTIAKTLHLSPETVGAALKGLRAVQIGTGSQTRWALPPLTP